MLHRLSWYICNDCSERLVLIFSLEATSFSTTFAHAYQTSYQSGQYSFSVNFTLWEEFYRVLSETESGKHSNLGGICEYYTRISSVPFLFNTICTDNETASRQYVWFKTKCQQHKKLMYRTAVIIFTLIVEPTRLHLDFRRKPGK